MSPFLLFSSNRCFESFAPPSVGSSGRKRVREGNGYISNTRQSCVVLVKLSRGNASDINRVAIGCAPCSRVTPIPRCSDFGASSFIVAGRWDDKRNEEEYSLSFSSNCNAYSPSNRWCSIVKRLIYIHIHIYILTRISYKEERVASDRSGEERETDRGCKRSNVSSKRCVKWRGGPRGGGGGGPVIRGKTFGAREKFRGRTGSPPHGEEATAAWQMRCEARGLRGVELAGAKAEVEKPKLPKAVAGAAAARGGTWRGPPEMTTLRRGIVAPRYNTYVLVSLIGLLLQTQSATGEWLFICRLARSSTVVLFYIFDRSGATSFCSTFLRF